MNWSAAAALVKFVIVIVIVCGLGVAVSEEKEPTIFDISHRYVGEMPAWESKEGVGQFLWLQKSIKNGSRTNNSQMQLPTHTGTHVDAPGHVFDHYFHAGFDVDSLDLQLLNGPALLLDVPRDKNITGI